MSVIPSSPYMFVVPPDVVGSNFLSKREMKAGRFGPPFAFRSSGARTRSAHGEGPNGAGRSARAARSETTHKVWRSQL
jgi:hypothetical protein